MKKYLKFAGACAALLALVGWILIMACPAVTLNVKIGSGSLNSNLSGVGAIFGADDSTMVPCALVSWIFVLVAFLALVVNFVLPLVKVNVLEKYGWMIDCCAALFLLVSGILCFCVQANSGLTGNNLYIGAGYVIAGILFILACGVAVVPTVFKFVDKK